MKKMILMNCGLPYGEVGTPTNMVDSNGNALHVGDYVETHSLKTNNKFKNFVVMDDCNEFIMGFRNYSESGILFDKSLYKIKLVKKFNKIQDFKCVDYAYSTIWV